MQGWNVQRARSRRMCGHYIMLNLGRCYSLLHGWCKCVWECTKNYWMRIVHPPLMSPAELYVYLTSMCVCVWFTECRYRDATPMTNKNDNQGKLQRRNIFVQRRHWKLQTERKWDPGGVEHWLHMPGNNVICIKRKREIHCPIRAEQKKKNSTKLSSQKLNQWGNSYSILDAHRRCH